MTIVDGSVSGGTHSDEGDSAHGGYDATLLVRANATSRVVWG